MDSIKTKTRPYWHVDAKWIAGIGLFFSLGACLLLYNLSALTERESAVNVSATIVAGLFSKDGLDDASGVAEFRKLAAHAKGSTLKPISQFPSITISKHDALTLSPRNLRIAIFSQLTGPIYDQGLEGAAKQFTSDPKQQAQFVEQASPLGVLTKSTHDLLHNLWLASVVVSVLLAAALIYFSAGWGRLVSPAMVLLAISPLGSLVALALLYSPSGENSFQSMIPSNVAKDIGAAFSHSYLAAFAAGLGLMLVAFLGKVVTVMMRQNHSAPKLAKS